MLPTGIVQEMRCAGSFSLQGWGAQRAAKAGCGEEEHVQVLCSSGRRRVADRENTHEGTWEGWKK